ncbi:hypothetical protein B0H13DRAFT_2382641 [Mycena leptocephala]|nr:hypothetical protein B0H13DRAFT_2382641 [Mycena leptocephala]
MGPLFLASQPVPKSILKKKYSREVTPTPLKSSWSRSSDEQEERRRGRRNERERMSRSFSSLFSVFFRRRHSALFVNAVVIAPGRGSWSPPELTASQLEDDKAAPGAVNGQTGRPPPNSGGPFVATVTRGPRSRPSSSNRRSAHCYSGNPSFPHALMSKSLGAPSFGSLAEQRARLLEIDTQQKEADAGPLAFWKQVDNAERVHKARRIREAYDRYAAPVRDREGQLDELVSRADQIQCGIRALASLLDEYLDLVMDLLHLTRPPWYGLRADSYSAGPKIRVLPPQPVASSSKKRSRDDDEFPTSPPTRPSWRSFDAYLKSHTGIASTLEKKVGSERIVFAGGCERCGRMGPCFTTLSASSSDKGAQGRSCLQDFIRFWNDQRPTPSAILPTTSHRQRRKEKPTSVKEEPGVDRKGKGKRRSRPPRWWGICVGRSLMTQPVPDSSPTLRTAASLGACAHLRLDALTPNPGDRLDPTLSSRDREFILRLVENLHPLRYRPPLSIGPTPSLHSDAYPVPVPELRGNVQWRALLHAYANELPIPNAPRPSELARTTLSAFATGSFTSRTSVLARLEDKSLFLPTDEPASPAHTPPPLDLPSLSGAIESSAPLVNDPRAHMSLAPNADVDMGPPDVPRVLSFGDPTPLLSPQRVVDTSTPAPSSVVADRAASEVGGSTRQPSVARSEAGDIIVNTGGRDESLSLALDSGLGDLGGAPAEEDVSMDVDEGGRSDAETLRLGAIDSREGSFDALEQEREVSREGTVGAETAGEKVDSREGSVGAGAASAS